MYHNSSYHPIRPHLPPPIYTQFHFLAFLHHHHHRCQRTSTIFNSHHTYTSLPYQLATMAKKPNRKPGQSNAPAQAAKKNNRNNNKRRMRLKKKQQIKQGHNAQQHAASSNKSTGATINTASYERYDAGIPKGLPRVTRDGTTQLSPKPENQILGVQTPTSKCSVPTSKHTSLSIPSKPISRL